MSLPRQRNVENGMTREENVPINPLRMSLIFRYEKCAHNSFDNLLMRFEEPSSMVRWDSPLISIPWDEEPPYEEIWNVVMKGEKKGPTAATLQVSY
jgi:tRNA uridine 5-carbamoylmethylation protein Kti12